MAAIFCADCAWSGDDADAAPLAEREIFERVDFGEIMPAGECPACGAVCHYQHNPHGVAQFRRAEWVMIADALDILQPDGEEADDMRLKLAAIARQLADPPAEDGPEPCPVHRMPLERCGCRFDPPASRGEG